MRKKNVKVVVTFEAARIVAVLEDAGKFKKAISEHGVVINLKDGR